MNSENWALDGVVVVDKPAGWTSHDVVSKLRGIAGTKRVGHLGTLDPIATGVLPLMMGNATRLARFWSDAEKCYEAEIRFGFATSTYDRAGEPCGPDLAPTVDASQIEALLPVFRGEISQTPPPVSAKKINGVPAYKLVRRNVEVKLEPVSVTIHELTLLETAASKARIRVRCSAGTYIRSIAHDLGATLGCGAHVAELVRIQSGPFHIEQARTIEQLQVLKDEGTLRDAILPMSELLPEMPSVLVDPDTESRIRQGRDFNVSAFRVRVGAEYVKAIADAGNLVAIGRIALPHVYHPIVVLPAAASS